MKVFGIFNRTHNPSEEAHWVSRLRENLTSGSDGEGLETGRLAPRQSFTRRVSRQGHIIQSVKVRPGPKDSSPVAWEVPWRESKMVKPSDKLFRKEMMQGFRPQRTVNADVASLHENPVAETVDHVRRQQESSEMSLGLRLSPAGYQRWHVARDYVSTGEALDVRRRNLVEEASPITMTGKWDRRRQGGGLGRSTVERGAAKRPGREGPRLMSNPCVQGEAVVK